MVRKIKRVFKNQEADMDFDNGNNEMKKGNEEEALAYYELAIEKNPLHAGAYNNRGIVKFLSGDLKGALLDIEKAIKINPNLSEPYNERGNIKKELGDLEGAILDYSKSLMLKLNKHAYNGRGNVKEKLGDLKGAIIDYNSALKIDKKYAESYNGRGNAKQKLGDIEGAILDYEKSIELNSKYSFPYNGRGNIKQELGDIEGAILDYNKAIELNEKYVEAYNGRGNAKEMLGDLEGAMSDYNKSIEINSKYVPAFNNRGMLYDELGEYEKALSDYNEAIRLNPSISRIYNNRGILYKKMERKNEALSDYNEAIKLNKKSVVTYNNRGMLYDELGEYEKALSDYNEAINLDSNYSLAYINRGIIYTKLNKSNEAKLEYEKAEIIDPENAMIYENKIKLLEKESRRDLDFDILKSYKKLLELKNEKEITKNLEEYISYFLKKEGNIKNEIINFIINEKMYFSMDILDFLFREQNIIEKFYPDYKDKVKLDFQNNLIKEKFGKDQFKKNDNIYYMCKEINKYTLESLVNNAVYKNDSSNFNDPFDPYFKKYETLLKDELKKIRVTCFSENYDNLLLWAHYGKNHKGICLGYEIEEKSVEGNLNISFKKVIYDGLETLDLEEESYEEYDREIKVLNNHKIKFKLKNSLNLFEIFLKKHRDWSYENEFRLIHLDINNSDYYFTNFKLKEVIFGIDTSESDIKLVMKILSNNKEIKFYKMKQDNNLTIKREEYKSSIEL